MMIGSSNGRVSTLIPRPRATKSQAGIAFLHATTTPVRQFMLGEINDYTRVYRHDRI